MERFWFVCRGWCGELEILYSNTTRAIAGRAQTKIGNSNPTAGDPASRAAMEGWLRRLLPSTAPHLSSISAPLLAVVLIYSFSSQFLPIEPYLVPYLTSVKHFTNYQVTVNIFPVSVYAQLLFTLLLAPACFYLSHKTVTILGALAVLATYLIVWGGESLLMMQLMQVTYGFGMSARLVFSSYIFLLVTEEEYQTMTSLTMATSLLSFMLAAELSQLLAFKDVSYQTFIVISLVALVICCAMTFLLPKDRSLKSSASLKNVWDSSEGWKSIMTETWSGWSLQVLSFWWAVTYAGVSLVQNYGTNLFDAVDSNSKYNGHVLAASQAVGSIGSYCAVYMENFAIRSGLLIYVLGSALLAVLCVFMGMSANIWASYFFYVILSGIYQTLQCLVSVRCGRLLTNGQFVLLFSVNNFAGLLIETLVQAAVEIYGLSIFAQFVFFAGFFFLATIIFSGLYFFDDGRSKLTTYSVAPCEPEHIISDSN